MASTMGTKTTSMDEISTKVEDYLNDKLQTPADLDGIESLLSSVKDQHSLLQKQLLETEEAVDQARQSSKNHEILITQRVQEFQEKQADIDRRLRNITDSSNSDEAVEKFEESMQKLRTLDIASGYFELLQEVDQLSADARKQIKVSPENALKPYTRLQGISNALKTLQPAAEDAAPHLVDHVDKTCGMLWRHMKDTLSVEFEQTLNRMGWPGKNMKVSDELLREWEAGTKKLLRLQGPELSAQAKALGSQSTPYQPIVLLPLEVMVKPLELRFRYHFEGDRPTNRLDKPEYIMTHVLELLATYTPFFTTHLQPVLDTWLQEHEAAPELKSLLTSSDAVSAFITALLPMLRRKVFNLLPKIAHQPQLLSHFVHELITFDTALRDEWGYKPSVLQKVWKGLTWEVLVEKNWFGRWLQVEKDFALSRYESIIDAKDAGELDYDSVDMGRTKPTKAAVRVNDLLESITDRYRPLQSFSQKLRFLIDIQLAIFDRFHTRLQTALEAYLAATSAVVRAMQGGISEDRSNVEGVKGLERLCRVHGSADYIAQALEDWSDDVFFLELWDELQNRARRDTGGNIAGPLTAEQVAERTSSAVGTADESGALFDETAEAYRKLRVRGEEMMIDLLNKTVRDALRPYSRINPWPLVDLNTSSSTETISAELEGALQPLDSCLGFLSRALSRGTLRHVGRQLSLFMQTYLWDYILMRHTFSENGAAQFCQDLVAIWRVLDSHLGPGQGERGMNKLKEAVILLSLAKEAQGEGGMGFYEAEEEIFASNEQARTVLDQLGLSVLTETEARSVLEHRVDVTA